VEEGQTPFVNVHAKILVPVTRPVIPVVADADEERFPPPETSDQVPVPAVGVFALMVAAAAHSV
jgi:hypothetical protein